MMGEDGTICDALLVRVTEECAALPPKATRAVLTSCPGRFVTNYQSTTSRPAPEDTYCRNIFPSALSLSLCQKINGTPQRTRLVVKKVLFKCNLE